MTVPQGAAVSIGAVLGTGVIALPALAAQTAGPASLVAWLALILLSVPLAWTFASLGARYPDAGGVSTYVRNAFGGRAAAVVGWCFYFAVPAGAPAAAMFGGAYVAAAFGGGLRTTLIASALMTAAVTVMNLGGVRVSGKLQLGLAALLVTLLLTATLTALPHAQVANLHPFAPHGWLAIGPAAAVLVWGFAGWEAVTSLAGDFRRPRRDVPRATAIAIVVVGLLYLGVAAASILVLGPATGSTEAPLAELLAIGVGGPVRTITAFVAVLLTMGAMNAYVAASIKLAGALAAEGAAPRFFARPRRALAAWATVAAALLVVLATDAIGLDGLVRATSTSFVAVYVVATAAGIRLLTGRARAASAVAFAAVVIVFAFSGAYLAVPAAVAAAALSVRRRTPITAAPHAAMPPAASTAAS